jgi:DNA-binding PucR family transcriptional regulator
VTGWARSWTTTPRIPADLVHTLGLYLAHGGGYDAASKALPVHRSMLK